MRLPRPYIPMEVRLQVALRQAYQAGYCSAGFSFPVSIQFQLQNALLFLFGDEQAHLDHDPALQNRERYADKTGIHYIPDANDPNYLIYRTAQDHKIKTLVRGDGAQHSDAALARKNKRIARNRDPKRRKRKWPTRPFPKRAKQ